MTKRPDTYSTLLYPGVILRGANILLSNEEFLRQTEAPLRAKSVKKPVIKTAREKGKRFVNLLIEK